MLEFLRRFDNARTVTNLTSKVYPAVVRWITNAIMFSGLLMDQELWDDFEPALPPVIGNANEQKRDEKEIAV